MTIDFLKSGGDYRGNILFFKSKNIRMNIFETKKGYARGGHFHQYPVTYILLSGKIEYRVKSLDNDHEIIKILTGPTIINLPINTANLIIAIEDSIFLEMFDNDYSSKIFDEYRSYVIKKNQSQNIDKLCSNLFIKNEFIDSRGKIFFCKFNKINLNLIETKKGYARGGHFHEFESDHIILFGKIKYLENNPSNNTELIKVLNVPEIIKTRPNFPHLFVTLEDSCFIEIFKGEYSATFFEEYRKIVNDKMKTQLK
tara:strand:- start:326 stop:1090 length:765 start_codon:yes stop_codon:yes gene_type:complete